MTYGLSVYIASASFIIRNYLTGSLLWFCGHKRADPEDNELFKGTGEIDGRNPCEAVVEWQVCDSSSTKSVESKTFMASRQKTSLRVVDKWNVHIMLATRKNLYNRKSLKSHCTRPSKTCG